MEKSIKMCKSLNENKTCKLKSNIENQHCTSNPIACCAFCNSENDNSCNSEKGICTILF